MLVFFFTDIEGSTRLWEEYTDDMGAVIARHDAILRQQIEACGGQITKHTGDGVTAAFDDGEPIPCAVETQKQFAAVEWGAIGELRIRIGLHAGEAELLHGDYFGPAVNCTARVMSAGWGGQILLTPEVTGAADLPAQATLRDLGLHLLKDVSAAQQIYQLVHPELAGKDFPPLRTLSGNAIGRTIDQEGQRLVALPPSAIAIGLVSATLLPTLLGDITATSPALVANLGVLGDMGADTLRDFAGDFVERLRGRQEAGEAVTEVQIRQQLEVELLERWQVGGDVAAALRADASRLLQAVQGVEAALQAAAADVKETLARGLADLGGTFAEFRWMLSGLEETLAEIRARQALQLGLQREQLDVQRQQLVKTNLLLQLQQQQAAAGVPAAAALAGLEYEEIAPADVPCPYKRLAAFDPEDAAYFFGRGELVAELTARLAGTRFLAVVGPSGSGKSSLVRAGLLPAIWQDALPDSKDWQTLVLTPGQHPLEELALRISLLNGFTAAALLDDLESHPRGLDIAVKQVLNVQPHHAKLLLVVDQFEEIFALCRDETERRRFIDALLYAVEAEDSRTVVVPTIRADFYGHCADYPNLAARLQDNVLVGPLSEDELRQVIERPAAMVGLRLEPGLVETIMGDVADEPGALPLLSHSLLETWERRRGHTLTLAGYTESGGVAGAIAQTADLVFQQLTDDQQGIARAIFLRLTELGEEGTQDTRRRVEPRELIPQPEDAPAVEAVLKTLADGRLITTGEETVEVAHEALIREWPALRGWLEEDREGLRTHRRLTKAAQEWERLDREPSELYRGARLATTSEWGEQHADLLNPLEREFLEASQELAQRRERQREAQRQRELEAVQKLAEAESERAEEQARATSRFRRLAAALAGVFLLALAAAVFARGQRRQAVVQANARATEVAVRSTAEADSLAAGATAVAESVRAERETRLATSRELAAAAISNLDVDPERSVLLALQAVAVTRSEDGIVTREAENALHQAVLASRVQLTVVHSGTVWDVAFHPDGTRFATASFDGTAKVWDASSGQELMTLSGHTGRVTGVAFSPDGTRLGTSSDDGTAKLWDAPSGQELMTLSGHAGEVWDVSFSPNGACLATASGDRTAKVWDVSSGQELMTLSGHTDALEGIAFHPDGTRLATASDDNTAKVWDAATGEELVTLSGHANYVWGVAFHPDGTRLATASVDGTAKVWDAASGQELFSLTGHRGEVWSVAFSPDGTRLATASPDGTAKVWDASSGREVINLAGHAGRVTDVVFSPDGERLATGSRDFTAKVWGVGHSREWLILSGHTDMVGDIEFSPDGTRLASASDDGTARLWDAVSGEQLLVLSGHTDWVNQLAFSSDGTRLATASSDDTARVWDITSGQELLTVAAHTDDVWGIAFSPDGTRLATTSCDMTVKVWDAASGQALLTISPQAGCIAWVVFSPDGTRLATAGESDTAMVWDASSGQELLTLSGHVHRLGGVVFSPDGTRLATSSFDATAKSWDAATGDELLTLAGHTSVVMGLAYSPDGTRLATGGADATTKLWDAATGQELLSLTGHTGLISAITFSPDGTRLATASYDGTVRVYVLAIEELVELAQSRVTRSLAEEECQQYLHIEECPPTP